MNVNEKRGAFSLFKKRRERLAESFSQRYGGKNWFFVLCAAFEEGRYAFRQNSSFYYLTGITEPAAVWCMQSNGTDVLYVPNFGNQREKWVNVHVSPEHDPKTFGFDAIKHLSDPVRGYSYRPFFKEGMYTNFLRDLKNVVTDQVIVLSLLSGSGRDS